ncbi:MAG: DUF1295 domain-containing protein [Clostridia bacterium]|nr:DUF1295 domain-containing protein [Clostridia bacterium]
MSQKTKGLLVNLLLYAAAFAVGAIPFALIDDLLLAEAAFTGAATLVIFLVTCFVPDTSLYDPYWSVAPPVMLLFAMVKYRLWSVNAILFFAAVCLWAIRLTGNWALTYKGLCREDWRYRQFREKCSPLGFFFINLCGLQFVPTIVVYLGLVGGFGVLRAEGFDPLILIGLAVMLTGVWLELISDRAIHRFLREHAGEGRTCDASIWRLSRHPNYLGELTFWLGVFLVYLFAGVGKWYLGLGFLSIWILFFTVSIPMMERHNLARREDYAAYRARTSVLIPLPPKKEREDRDE